ncbi:MULTISPECIES: hypothetical protein [Nocardioides]|uniref:Glycosyltransferase RgtA/B/C/D-like domain-containing protein n=1 Tax=Nocardioides vastitatis TaxID=2568655 RepID=A0ABW0ZIQ9_9ACTN|nr:hypothetical protein [Nocardioides sp.]THJ12585.1 hypothetical protein E7Z54_02010 [Nocardioides sp.]
MPDESGAPPPGQRFPLLARAWPATVGLAVACVGASVAKQPFRAFDTYFHLRFGDEFRGSWSISDPGQPSTASTNDWLPTQWLAQVGLSLVSDSLGTTGLVIVFAALVSALAAGTYLLVRSWASLPAATIVTPIVLLACLPSVSLRPQMLSFLFATVVVASWAGVRRSRRVPWWLVPLGWLWAVCHGMWILGVAMSLVLAVAVCVERRAGRRETLLMLSVPAGMLLAVCLTPAGPRLIASVLLVNSRAEYFREWGPPDLASAVGIPVTLLLFTAVLLTARRGHLASVDVALLGLGTVFSLYSLRTLPLAAVVLAPLVGSELSRLRAQRTVRRTALGRPELTVVAGLSTLLVILAPLLPDSGRDEAAEQLAAFDARLEALRPGEVVLTDRVSGAVLLWTHPELDVPIHGYGDVYTDDELESYRVLVKVAPGWERTLSDLRPSAAVMPDDLPLTHALLQQGWSVTQQEQELLYLSPPETA